jgi:putative DNA primase/helicase
VHGPGGNGKSVFLNTLTGIMGEYATTAPSDIFTISIGERHPTELAMLRGARLVAASETEQGKAGGTRIKQLTGGDEVSARFMRCDYFKFRPAFRLTIIGNHQPTLENVDAAVRRRFNVPPVLPFARTSRITSWRRKLREEWPEILRWMIRGCLDWQRNGLLRLERVRMRSLPGWTSQHVATHLTDEILIVEIIFGRGERETTTELYRSWSAFAKQAGTKPDTEKNFVGKLEIRKFENRNLKRFRTNRARGFEGIRLKVWGDGQ